MMHITTQYNFADTLTKHCSYHSTYHELIQSLFHHEGNTTSLFLDDILEVDLTINEGNSKIIFDILVRDRTLCQPQNITLVC